MGASSESAASTCSPRRLINSPATRYRFGTGGVYALEQLSELDSRYRGHAHALLTAFVRQHVPWPSSRPDSEVLADRARLQGGLADDIGAAISVLGRQAMIAR